jgi:hypothetical protein
MTTHEPGLHDYPFTGEPPLPPPPPPPGSSFWSGSPQTLPPPPGHQPTKKPLWRRKWVLITAGIVLLLIIIGAAGGGGSKPTAQPTNPPSTSLPPAQVAPPVGVAPPAEEPPTTEPAPSQPPSTAQAAAAWWTGGSTETDWSALGDDMTAISDAAGNYDITAINTACTSLATDATQFRTHLPAPDAELNRHMTAATSLLGQAATVCVAGDYAGSADLANQATTEIQASTDRVTALTT